MLRLLAFVAFLFAVPLVVAWFIAREVLHPRRRIEDHDLQDFDLPAQDVSFSSRDGTRLRGWFIPARDAGGPAPGVVLSHGWARSRAELLPHANFLHHAGFAVLMFDYRHRGESGGGAVTAGVHERDDLRAAIDLLAARPEVDRQRIGVFGMSMGGVIAVLVTAADPRVRALMIEAPYGGIDAIMTRALRHYYHLPAFPVAHLARWFIERQVGEALEGVQTLPVVHHVSPRPLFVIADANDAVIGYRESQRVFEAAGEPKRYWLIDGADHARGWQAAPEEYERRAVEFLREALEVDRMVPAQYARSSDDDRTA